MMEYYYSPKKNIYLSTKEIKIDDFEYKHLVKVLRKNEGDKITVTDGEGNIYHCIIARIEKEIMYCSIVNSEYNLNESKSRLTLYMSPLRNLSRFEFAVEKAVELGVYSIQPLLSEFTINKNHLTDAKMQRLKKIIISAMGQSQRCILPELLNSIDLSGMIKKTKTEMNKIVMYEYSGDTGKVNLDGRTNHISLLIGPEGGFSKGEIESLVENGWLVRSLGARKLRSETAAIVSVYKLLSENNLIQA